MKEDTVILDNLMKHFENYTKHKNSFYIEKIDNLNNLTQIIVRVTNPKIDLAYLDENLGFKGLFYNIPYAHIDFKLDSKFE